MRNINVTVDVLQLRKKISAIEDDILRAKRWEMSGEAAANSREKNELLDVHLAFEHASKSGKYTNELEGNIELIVVLCSAVNNERND
jgi:U3 small nucleolar ribonucleoprotein component